MLRLIGYLILTFAALPTSAAAFERISDRGAFVAAVGGKDLKIALYGLTLNVEPNGTIEGTAMGWDISGSWAWENGYFCRDMDWSGTAIEYNCQLVELDGDRIRFTVDQGAGEDAVLRIR